MARTPEPRLLLEKIVSGGQTGADRGGLDAARRLGLEHGGWCPKGRRAEDGVVPKRYRMQETPTAVYRERTVWNVRDSDATVLFTRGPAVGGSRLTMAAARALRKPRLHIDLASIAADEERERRRLLSWLTRHRVRVLNVAGARESQEQGVGAIVLRFLLAALRMPLQRPPSRRTGSSPPTRRS